MSKIVAILIGLVIVVGGGAAFMFTRNNDDEVKVTNTETGASTDVKTGEMALINVDACDVLTADAAKQILGDAAKKADVSAGNASSADVSVSNCIYNVDITPGALKANNTKGVSVLARSAKTQAGADSNKVVFGPGKPAGVEDVSGIGDSAYFNPQFGQLNVLKGGNWYIVTSYSGKPTSATLADDKKLAELLEFK